ncbi:PREDICTED: ras association domain-containing protein 5 isoform X2 [Lepidothrix coronata]|uniref:Ras association domain-containing protein 5 n=1 Tax=Lepidothrix coronata TaxID=321398 RepID=A0A6J0ILT3_9PASS|nr:PREDICTED: ras association domain-containing protein 5 isoform X2 [Lepidothrix coronata]XP_017687623.1 PREDICTED: ras association domain-containing protein 5 isoform X2 [Lepidothrix coronata]
MEIISKSAGRALPTPGGLKEPGGSCPNVKIWGHTGRRDVLVADAQVGDLSGILDNVKVNLMLFERQLKIKRLSWAIKAEGGCLLQSDCRYTCHQECRSLIQLDCRRPGPCQGQLSPESTLLPPCSQNVTQTVEEEKPEPPTVQEIKQRIEKYNAKVTNCLLMKLNEDGTYTGFIKVHLKLRRPVTVPTGIRPQSIYDALKEVNLADMTDKRTSFYLPLDAIKQLHISSTTTVSEVIQGLLKKFMVVDNPQKFALFKEMRKDGQVLFQKLPLTEYPLYLRLLAGPDTDVLSFVLKENETGEVEWDAFSIPELQNFLMILDKEEKDKIQQVHRKYERFKQRLQQTLKEARGKPG